MSERVRDLRDTIERVRLWARADVTGRCIRVTGPHKHEVPK